MTPIHSPIDKRVFELVTVQVGDPAVGQPLSWTVNDNQRVEILSVSFLFVASGVGANRVLQVWSVIGGQGLQQSLAKGVQTAGETCQYHFAVGTAGEDEITDHEIQCAALATDHFLAAGEQLKAIAWDQDAGDQISNGVIRYKRWITE